jgi:inorganic pyrophosphatase
MRMDRDRVVDVLIETPKGSRKKYEWDHDRGAIRLDRRLYSSTVYPADYGFIPDTAGSDGEALDILVLTDDPTFPGCWMSARPVGVVWIVYGEDQREAKVIAVPADDPTWEWVGDLDDLPSPLVDEIGHFFDVYKQLEPSRTPELSGFGGAGEAWGAINAAASAAD